jgi:hypothetical protein
MEKLEWQAPEYIHTDKTSDWYWIVMIVSISITLICIILGDAIFGILILISSVTLSLFAAREPEMMPVTIDNRGVQAGTTFYPYDSVESFWVETRYAYPKVLLKTKKVFVPIVGILLHDMDPDQAKAMLGQHLPEHEQSEPLLEKILVRLGF